MWEINQCINLDVCVLSVNVDGYMYICEHVCEGRDVCIFENMYVHLCVCRWERFQYIYEYWCVLVNFCRLISARGENMYMCVRV